MAQRDERFLLIVAEWGWHARCFCEAAMNQGMAWPILGAVIVISLAACGGAAASGEGSGGDASTADAGQPSPGASDAANDVPVDAPGEASDGGTPVDAADGSSTTKAVGCPALADGGFAAIGGRPGESPASGTIVGSAVNCSLCDVGTLVYAQTIQDGGPSTSYTLYLSNTVGGENTCTVPSDFSNPTFMATIQLSGIQPGTYSSSQPDSSSVCTNIGLDYGPSTSADCEDTVGPYCPAGCEVFDCIDAGADAAPYCPCIAILDCSAFGSWQVVLTSVAAYAGDAGQPDGTVFYTVHGSITAVGSAGDGGPPAADLPTLSLTF
jgi:hypothetical protein